MIIGLTGKNGAGKGEVAEILKEAGFAYFSLSDIIRREIVSRGQVVSRDSLIAMGRELRTTLGPSALAEKILPLLDIDKNYIVDSIRNPYEVKILRTRKDFVLWSIEADQKLRFNRIKERARENDPTDFAKFVTLEEAELSNPDPAGQQLTATGAMADRVLSNGGTLDELKRVVRESLKETMAAQVRPNWDQYFMDIARMASLRSNCIKRKVAAVIVKDKRVISTGYNGTPRGVTNCCDGGCPRCNGFGKSGEGLGECLCSHAEENSIVQAAYHGVSIAGATIYTTFSPCLMCTKMILNSGLHEVVYSAEYAISDVPLKLLKEAGIMLRQVGT